MAEVYLGKHRLHLREDAIKIPLPEQLNNEVRRQFLGEARIAAGFDHEAIVPVRDAGQEGDVPYMVMRYMTGGSLADRLKSGPYTLAQALPVLERIAAALDYVHVHGRGAIHRDVKPGNILFDDKGQAFLSDFGIARIFAPDGEETQVRRTAPGMARATFAYASPEQVQATSDLDRRSDLYSLGVVVFEMLSGDVPYQADSGVQLAVLHVTAPIPSICQRRPELPPTTQAVINKALAKQPDDRYQTGAALVEDLRRVLTGRPLLYAAQKATRRRPGLVAGGALLVFLAVALALGLPRLRRQQVAAEAIATHEAQLVALVATVAAGETAAATAVAAGANDGTDLTPTPPSDDRPTPSGETIHVVAAGENLFRIGLRYGFTAQELAAYNGLSESDLNRLYVGQELRIPPREGFVPPAASSAGVDSEGVVFQSNRDGDYELYFLELERGEITALTNNAADDNFPRVSPDGRRVAFVSERDGNPEIYVMNRDGSGQTRLTNDPAEDNLPAWSPDGRQLVFVSSRDGLADLFVMDADGGNVRQITDTPLREGHASWSANGHLAFNASDALYWQLYVADVDGTNARRITNSTYDEWSPEWSPDGQWLLFHSERDSRTNPGIYLMRADGGEVRALYNGAGEEWGATWSPDGTQIVFAADQADDTADLFLMNADGSDVRRLLERGGYPSWAARSPAGVAPAATRQALSGVGLTRLTFGENDHSAAALSPDQSFLLVSVELDDGWHIFEADPNGGGLRRQITFGDNDYFSPEPLAGGEQFLAAANLDGETDIYLIKRTNGQVAAQLTDDPAREYGARALPDGSGFVFTSERDGDTEVYRATFDGQLTRLTDNDVFDGFPSVSADGQWLAFQSGRDGDYEIYVMTANGGQPRRLTTSVGRDASPTFSPDGQWVVFESERSGNYEIYAVPLAGGEPRQLTDSPGGNWAPTVSPDGLWLLFQSDRDGYMDIYRQPLGIDGGVAVAPAEIEGWAATLEAVATTLAPTPQPPTPITPTTCRYIIDRRWAGLGDAAADELGCPIGPAAADNGAFQYYEGGTLVWREDPDVVFVLYDSGIMDVYPSTGPKNYYVSDMRKGAFGYLWDNNETVRELLGQPLAIEQEAGGFLAQVFDGGALVYFDDSGGQYYALFNNNGTWASLR